MTEGAASDSTAGDRPQLFVSYAGEDAPIASELGTALRSKLGIDAFVAMWEIHAGDDVVSRLNAGLAANYYALLLSPASIGKSWPVAEQDLATLRGIEDGARVIPVILGLPRQEIPPLLRRLRWVDLSDGNTAKAADEIASAVFARFTKPPLAHPPKFSEAAPLLWGLKMRPVDATVLRTIFRCGIGRELLQPTVEDVEKMSEEEGISKPMLDESLEYLREQRMLTLQRAAFSGPIYEICLTPSSAETCCLEQVSDYAERKRAVLAALVNHPYGVNSDQLVEETGQERWLVCHVLRWAEGRGWIKIRFVNVGHDSLSVHWVAPSLKRDMQES